MSTPVSGGGGSGSVVAYTLSQGERAVIETLCFEVATNATAGTHAVQVDLVIPTVGTVASLMDLNIGGPGQVNFYSYGVGLNASACTITTGMAVTDALPEVELPPGSEVQITAVNGAGVEIAGDQILNVLLMLSSNGQGNLNNPIQDIFLMPGQAAA